MTYFLNVLGTATLAGPEGPLTGPASQRHRVALLTVLAVHHPRPVSREKLAGLLWPEKDEEHARALLNQSVHVLRSALDEEAIRSSQHGLDLRSEVVLCDVIEFCRALEVGELDRAVRIPAGPLLDGFFLPDSGEFEHWVHRERARFTDAWAGAVEALADDAERRGDRRSRVRWWRILAAHDPVDSRIAVRLMQALDADGNPAGALKHAADHSNRLRAEFGVEPSGVVLALVDAIRRRGIAIP